MRKNRELSIEAIVIGVKYEVIQEKEAQPVAFANARVTTDCVVLVTHPHRQNDVERGCCVVEELRHYGFHSCNINFEFNAIVWKQYYSLHDEAKLQT